jgi:hypothetical protein
MPVHQELSIQILYYRTGFYITDITKKLINLENKKICIRNLYHHHNNIIIIIRIIRITISIRVWSLTNHWWGAVYLKAPTFLT